MARLKGEARVSSYNDPILVSLLFRLENFKSPTQSNRMVGRENMEAPGAAGRRLFATSQWSVVLAAKDRKSSAAAGASEQLCRTYWYPLAGEVV